MVKRVICLILILTLSVPLFCISASASSFDVAPAFMYDLLNSMEFSYYTDNTLTSVKNTPMSWLPEGYDHKIQWKIPNYLKFNKIVIDVVSSVRPDNVRFTNMANTVSMEYLGTYGSGQLQKYQYVVSNPSLVLIEMAVIIQHEAMTAGYFGVVSCVGYSEESIPVESVNYFSNAAYFDRYDHNFNGTIGESYKYISAGYGNSSLPLVCKYDQPFPEFRDPPIEMPFGEAFIKFPVPDGLAVLDSLDILINTINIPYEIGARLETLQGVVVSTLPVSYYSSGETQRVVDMYSEELFYRTTVTNISIDISGYDLEDLCITLFFKCPSVALAKADSCYGFYWSVDGAAFRPESTEITWYNIFGKWLSDTFKPIFKTIEGYVTNIFVRLGNFWNDFLDFADDILASLGFDSEEVEDFESDISDKSEEISGVGEKFDSVSKPNISPGSVDIMGDLDASATANINLLVSPILSNEFVVKIILMVLTFTLVSYVLFGKR